MAKHLFLGVIYLGLFAGLLVWVDFDANHLLRTIGLSVVAVLCLMLWIRELIRCVDSLYGYEPRD